VLYRAGERECGELVRGQQGSSRLCSQTGDEAATALLPNIPNYAAARRTSSIASVEIREPYIVMDLGGDALITLNQRVQGSSP
jgi:hypothetical protein